MRRKMLILFMAVVGAMTGCGSGKSESTADNGELNVFVWTEYVPDSVFDKCESIT